MEQQNGTSEPTNDVSQDATPQEKEEMGGLQEETSGSQQTTSENKKNSIEELVRTLTQEKEEVETSKQLNPAEYLSSPKETPPPIINQGETEITPEDLESRIAARDETLIEQIKNEVRQEFEVNEKREKYKNTIASHLSQLEEVKKLPLMDDEDFANEVKTTYEAGNWVIGINGEPVFVGAVTPREAYDLTVKKFEKIKEKLSGQVAKKLTDQISSLAVSPTKGEPYDETEALKERAIKSGSEDDWARYLKNRLSIKN